LEALFTTGLLASVRLLSRALAESVREDISSCKRVILSEQAQPRGLSARDHRPRSVYVAVGCLDDDPSKLGIRVENVRVLGTADQLTGVLSSNPADEVLIAVPSATAAEMRRFVKIALVRRSASVPFRHGRTSSLEV